MAGSGFDFQKLIEESKSVLTNPKGYFATMAKEGGFVEPIIKALVYGVVAGIISLIWALLHISAMFGTAGPISSLIGAIIAAVVGLFITGIIILILSAICSGNTNFEANVRVSAAVMIFFPIMALISFLQAISVGFYHIIYVLISLYSLYILYFSLTAALTGKEKIAKIICIILAVLLVIYLIFKLT